MELIRNLPHSHWSKVEARAAGQVAKSEPLVVLAAVVLQIPQVEQQAVRRQQVKDSQAVQVYGLTRFSAQVEVAELPL
jgi:hypothetical protein